MWSGKRSPSMRIRAVGWRAWMPGDDSFGHGQLGMGLDDVDGGLRNRQVLEVRDPVGLEAPCGQTKAGVRDEPFELRQDQRMAPIETDQEER